MHKARADAMMDGNEKNFRTDPPDGGRTGEGRMSSIATIKDVARKAGVSISTVSRVLNNTQSVSPELAEKVNSAVERLGYCANAAARGLRVTQTNRVAIILTSLSRVFFTSVLEGIHREASQLGYSLLITETHDNIQEEIQAVDFFASQWVDGIILASSAYGTDKATRDHIARLSTLSKKDTRIPVVTLEFPLNNPQVGAVVIDHEQAAYEAVRYLIRDLGRRHVVHISHPAWHFIGQKRILGYRRAMESAGFSLEECTVLEGNYSTYSGHSLTHQMLKRRIPCDAIFCANDQIAVGALKACEEAGVSVPEQIAIVGIDDIFAASIVSPSLTSIHVPKHKMGASAMQLLHTAIEQNGIGRRKIIKLDFELIERETTRKGAENSLRFLEW